MPMLNLTYVAQGAAVSRLSRVSSPATQLRFGALLLRPGRTVSTPDSALKPHLDAVCDAMARGVLVVRNGARNLDGKELRSLVISGAMPAGQAAALPDVIAAVVKAETAPVPVPEPEAAVVAEPPAAEPVAEAAAEAEIPAEAEPAPAASEEAQAPEASSGKKRKGR